MTFPVRVSQVYGANQHTVHGGAGMKSALAGGALGSIMPRLPVLKTRSLSPTPQVNPEYRDFLTNDASLLAVIDQIRSLKDMINMTLTEYRAVAARNCNIRQGRKPNIGASTRCNKEKIAAMKPLVERYNQQVDKHEQLVADFRKAEERALARMTQTFQHGGHVVKPMVEDGAIKYTVDDGTEKYSSIQEAEATIDLQRAEEGEAEVQQWRQQGKQAEVALATIQRIAGWTPWLLAAGVVGVGAWLLLRK